MSTQNSFSRPEKTLQRKGRIRARRANENHRKTHLDDCIKGRAIDNGALQRVRLGDQRGRAARALEQANLAETSLVVARLHCGHALGLATAGQIDADRSSDELVAGVALVALTENWPRGRSCARAKKEIEINQECNAK